MIICEIISSTITQTREFKRWFSDSKIVDKNGNPLILYRGLRGIPLNTIDRMEGRSGYAMFFSSSPYVAATYAQMEFGPFEKADSPGAIFPVYVKAHILHEFPSHKGVFNFFEFDRFAMRLGIGEGLVVRESYDVGPRADLQSDPDRLYSYPADTYSFGRGTSIKSATGNRNFNIDEPQMHL
jgi:hypothetical protein